MRVLWILSLITGLLLLAGTQKLAAQDNCDDLLLMNPGNQVFKNRVCAPVPFKWLVFCKKINNKSVTFIYDWGDGTLPEEKTPTVDLVKDSIYFMASHTYPDASATVEQCSYQASVSIKIDGDICTDNVQTQNVVVWDVDDKNGGTLNIDPMLFRVCVGNDATVQFNDVSNWNCVPPDISEDFNKANRWTQWQYGTGASTIGNVEVNGTVQPYPFVDPVNHTQYYPNPALSPSSTSDAVYVPNTATLGQTFNVTLRNWNQCNAYDDDLSDGYDNPADLVNGDNAPIETVATIIIVDKVAPDFYTEDDAGLASSDFCIGENINFIDNTPGIAGAGFAYSYEYFDDEFGTVSLGIDTIANPNFSYASTGKKLIRLSIIDENSVNQCGDSYDAFVNIIGTAVADIDATNAAGNPLTSFCMDASGLDSFTVNFNNNSTGVTGLTTWIWNFYKKNSTSSSEIVRTETTFGPFQEIYTEPGSYLVELITSEPGVDCETRDSVYVYVYSRPEAIFTADTVCLGELTTLTDFSSIPIAVNADLISSFEWDFDYDGVTFSADTIVDNNSPFTHYFNTYSNHLVALKVITQKGNCDSPVFVDTVFVNPVPYSSYSISPQIGCPDLETILSIDTLLMDQPIGIDQYIWHFEDYVDNSTSDYIIDPPQNSFGLPPLSHTRADNLPHDYGVQLEIHAANGCNVTGPLETIQVLATPESGFFIKNFTAADKNCSPRNFEFEANTTTKNLLVDTYHWTIEDEDSVIVVDTLIAGSIPNFSYVLINKGMMVKNFTITLQPEKSDLCIQPSFLAVSVNPVPNATFTITKINSNCDWVTYDVEATQNGMIYNWSVNPPPANSPDLTSDKFEITINRRNGSNLQEEIKLITTNVAGCKSPEQIETVVISEKENINASFSISPEVQQIPNTTIQIQNFTNPGNWLYAWNFGDSTSSNLPDPDVHNFESYGEYPIKLTVSGTDCYETDSVVAIIEPTLPVVDFSYTAIKGCLPLEVKFTNLSKYANPDTYYWDFGDGVGNSTEVDPTYVFRKNGTFTVTLEASNILGILIKAQKTIYVDLETGPQADFGIQEADYYLPDVPVYFSNFSLNADNYQWDFGDGSGSFQEDPDHLFRNSGDFEVTQVAYNANGCTDTLIQTITISPIPPIVDFEISPVAGCRPLTVHFTNLSRYAASYYWSFGRGEGVSTAENPSYTYYQPGIYSVSLQATNSGGVTLEKKKEFSVEVYDNPGAGFSIRPEEVFLTQPIYLANLSHGATTFWWDFGDGKTSNEFEPDHVYENTGTYSITLIATNEYGCTDTLRRENSIFVKEGGEVQIPNAFTPSLSGPGATENPASSSYNDVFLPIIEGVTGFHMLIYNRWGELLFESFDKNLGWDGYFNGKLSPKDVYVFKLLLKFSDGRMETKAGDVTLLR